MAKRKICDDERKRENLIKGVPNHAIYDDKVPTNLRLERHLKEKAVKDARKSGTTLSDIVNGLLRDEYGIHED